MAETPVSPKTDPILEEQWQILLHFLPKGWQDAAWTLGAIIRRRAIESAESLLRLVLAYAWNDWSLRSTAAWAGRIGLADLSDVAVLKRLRHAHAWLGYLLDRWFHEHGIETTTLSTRFRLVITDGTTVPEPGSRRTTWRLHAQWNLAENRWEGIVLTDAHGAESLTRLPLRPHDVVLADRNYAKPRALAWIVDQHADVIARFGWNALRWETLDGQPWHVLEAVRTLPDATPGSWWVQIRPDKSRPPLPLRVVAIRKSPAAAKQSRRKAAKDHGYTVSAATLEAADYVLILTTLSEAAASAADILALYRLRWQIECAFKRLKSVLYLDHLRTFDPDLAQTYLLAKILGALLVDAIRTPGPAFSPYGFPVHTDTKRRLALYPNGLASSPSYCARHREPHGLANPAALDKTLA